MLVTMLPNQVSEMWPILKGHIEDTLPPTADYGNYNTENILWSVLTGYAQIWLYKNDKQENQGFVLTTIINDISGVRVLLIYNMVVIDKEAKVDWKKEFTTLRLYANSMGCAKIGAYVMNPKILNIVKEHNVETRFTFAFMNI